MRLTELSARERRDWLRLSRTERIGPVTFFQLVRRFGSAGDALQALPELSAKQRIRPAATDAVEAELEAADRLGFTYIAACEPAYPNALRNIPDAPPILCVAGDPALLSRNCVGMVGARNASLPGRRIATDLARDLGAEGVIVVSGLARGIDGAAHQAALGTGTVAVVAGGADNIYPPEHRDLTEAIIARGALVSERPVGYKPIGRDFPRRNRIISGLSLGVIVVEAALKSGTLITARYAAEQGREVFAVPGSPLEPRSQGTNRLIRDGATLIENADDVLSALQGSVAVLREPTDDLFDFADRAPQGDPEALSRLRREIAGLLSVTPVHRDMLLRETGAAPALLADALLDLVLAGDAEEHTGGRFSIGVSVGETT